MSKKKEKTQGPTLDETVIRLETRLREFEDRTAKKIKDLEDLVEYLTNKVEINHSSSFSLLNGQTPPLTIDHCQQLPIAVDKSSWILKRGK